jgi:RNA polymerase sigma-70 factor (ECF subfamily)
MGRVRAGHAEAAAELLRHYEPVIRREVRVRLRVQDARVRRMLDSMDIAQSVLAGFFAGVAAGRVNPESPQQLVGLLAAVARNKLLSRVRDQRRQRRDARRLQSLDAAAHDVPARQQTPSQVLAAKDLLGEFHKRLTEEELRLAERRGLGQPWSAIATELGGTPEGRRKQLERAFARVRGELGLGGGLPPTPAA